MRKNLTHAAVIAVFALAVFLPSLWGGFLWDDEFLIVHNPAIKSLKNIPGAFTRSFFHDLFETPQITFYRPLVTTINTVQYALFHLRPFWWHLFNILVHSVNAVMVYFFLVRIAGLQRSGALWGGMIFAVHPVHSEAVCFISGRTDLLALFFLMGTFFLIEASGKRRGYRIFALFFFAMGLLCKELVLMFPVAMATVYFIRGKESGKGMDLGEIGMKILPFLILGGIYLFVRFFLIRGIETPRYPGGSLPATWLTMPKLFWRYAILTAAPVELLCDYTSFFEIEKSLMSPGVLFPGAFFIGFLILTVVLFWRGKKAGLGMAWFLLFLVPVLNLFPLGLWMAERFLYIPSIGFSILLGLVLSRGDQREVKSRATTKNVLAITLILILAGLGFARSFVWRDALTLWTGAVKKNPRNPQARIIFAQILNARGRFRDAEVQLLGANTSNSAPLSLKKEQTFVKIHTATGQWDKADAALSRAFKILPDSARNRELEGRLLLEQGKGVEAEAAFRSALEKNPRSLAALGGLMEILSSRTEGLEEVLSLSERAMALNPDYLPSYIYRGMSLKALGRFEEAAGSFRRAIRLSPDSPSPYMFLADLHESLAVKNRKDALGHIREAMALYRGILERHPDHTGALNNLAILFARTGRRNEARALWKRILEIDPSETEARQNLRRLESGGARGKDRQDP